jgi:hypothetical protein
MPCTATASRYQVNLSFYLHHDTFSWHIFHWLPFYLPILLVCNYLISNNALQNILYLHVPVITGLWINVLNFCILHPIRYRYISYYQHILIIYFKLLFLWSLFCLGNGSDTSVILFYTFHVSILLYFTSLKMAVWLAKTCRKVNMFIN